MSDQFFEWNPIKADVNRQKHGVTFNEAKTVFDDPLAVIFDDEAHSVDEPREIIIGHSLQNNLLLVCFTDRDGCIRLISARRATARERYDYESGTSPV
ncbi:MAG: BrnT family toxin [Chloroflexales bacterium]